MRKLRKRLLILLAIIIILAGLVVAFISPITKYLIEKYDEQYTGRQVTMDWAYVNPFTGYIHFSGLKIYEYKSDSLFISMHGLSANFEVHKLFSKTIEISDFTLDQPQIVIAKTNRHFNFDDMVTKFSSTEPRDTNAKTLPVSLHNIVIKNGHFYYFDKGIPVTFSVKNVEIASKEGWSSEKDDISADFSFLSEIGTGGMKGVYGMNLKKLDYKLDVKATHFDLKVFEQYMNEFTNYGTLRANLDADLKTNGNFNDAQNITIKGELAVSDFHFGKNPKEDYCSFDKVVFNMKEVNPKRRIYFIDSMMLVHPFFKYEQYEYSNNLETMFGKNGANAAAANSDPAQFNIIFAIGQYIEELAKNFLHSNYKVNKLGIYECNLEYNDYTLSEKFSAVLSPLEIRADSIYKTKARVNLSFHSGILPYGTADMQLSINPKDTSDFDIRYTFQKIPLSMLNPYFIAYTSFPLDRGTLELNGVWNVRNGNIQSNNHLLVIDPRLTKRVKDKKLKWVPMRLIMALVRETGNVIDYEIPITGNLNNPKFHWSDIIIDIFQNIFVKPVTTPYRIQIRNIETEIEKSLTLKWPLRNATLTPRQERFIEKMADFLVENPKASIEVSPQNYTLKEKEYILFFEAKKKYYLTKYPKKSQSFSKADAEMVAKMSIKDTNFVHYLNKQVNNPLVFTVQEKCRKILSVALVNSTFDKLNNERAAVFMAYFKKRDIGRQIHFSKGKDVVPYNGFSFYKIDYQGFFPEPLLHAYLKMNNLDNKPPRAKLKKERRKIR